jgi:hypothetical protein
VKSAPLRTSDRAKATAAYEHDDDAAPSPVAVATLRGRSSGSSRAIVDLRTTEAMIADRVKPRIKDQVTCQVINPATRSACRRATSERPGPAPADAVVGHDGSLRSVRTG